MRTRPSSARPSAPRAFTQARVGLLAVVLLGAIVLMQSMQLGHGPAAAAEQPVSRRELEAAAVGTPPPIPSQAPPPPAQSPPPPPAESSPATASSPATVSTIPAEPYFIVIGMPSGVDQRNRERRTIMRDLWFPEYSNIGKTLWAEFLISLLTARGEAQPPEVAKQLHGELQQHRDMVLLDAREPTSDPNRRHPVNSGEKVLAWFRYAVVQHYGTRFFIKADWDTWVHATKLEFNLRLLDKTNEPAHYFGVTVWCSYSVADFQPCGYGLGPLMAGNLQKADDECSALPGGADAVGPFPFTVGMMWGMSDELIRWIVNSRWVYDFAHNASGRFRPPFWVKGEDSAFGFFAHLSPFALTARHWGWEKLHDSYEVGWAEKGINAHHVHAQSLAVHAMQKRKDFELVRKLMRDTCNESCIRTPLKFEVDGLKDLCGRNPNIPKVYAKCEKAGFPRAEKAALLKLPPMSRPLCRSMSNRTMKHVLEVGHPGGYILCNDTEAGKDLVPGVHDPV